MESEQPAVWPTATSIRRSRKYFRRLLRLLELPPVLAATLADWLDADSETSPDGAEDAYYLDLSRRPIAARTAPLSDVDGLLRVRGFDAAAVERLRAHVTALPGYHRVNVNTASAIVLAALVPDLSPSEVQQLLALREENPVQGFRRLSHAAAQAGDRRGRGAARYAQPFFQRAVARPLRPRRHHHRSDAGPPGRRLAGDPLAEIRMSALLRIFVTGDWPARATASEWALYDASGQLLQRGSSEPRHWPAAEACELVLSADQCLTLEAKLPKGVKRRQRAAGRQRRSARLCG